MDNDFALNESDNCPMQANANQQDNDADRLGDVCDTDDDNDGILDKVENAACTPASTTCDTDGDGIPNSFDLDSDGDACPDAVEAGVKGTLISGSIKNGTPSSLITTSNVQKTKVAAPYGSNGLSDGTETALDNGIISYTNYYNFYAVSSTLNMCADFDLDGVPDLVDIDDDNDVYFIAIIIYKIER